MKPIQNAEFVTSSLNFNYFGKYFPIREENALEIQKLLEQKQML